MLFWFPRHNEDNYQNEWKMYNKQPPVIQKRMNEHIRRKYLLHMRSTLLIIPYAHSCTKTDLANCSIYGYFYVVVCDAFEA